MLNVSYQQSSRKRFRIFIAKSFCSVQRDQSGECNLQDQSFFCFTKKRFYSFKQAVLDKSIAYHKKWNDKAFVLAVIRRRI